MTKEESIAYGKECLSWNEFSKNMKMYQFIEMAIQALSQEPCDDAISRILKRMWNCRGKHTTSIDKVKMEQIIRDELPSVTTKSIECDDAVSRDAVLEAVSEGCQEWRGIYGKCEELINALPPVTQKSVLEQITAEIYEHFMTIDGGVHDASAIKCMDIIDKYK